MGKRKNRIDKKDTFRTQQLLLNPKATSLAVFRASTSNILKTAKQRNKKLIRNIREALRKISLEGQERNKKRLMSALNIVSENEIPYSAKNIPSIENMIISKKDLLQYDYCKQECSDCDVSVVQSASLILLESEPDMMLSYICLIEKALNKLGVNFSTNQNEKLIKGIWNILVKYWIDENQNLQYSNLNDKIEWGLLQLFNFELKVGKKSRVLMEIKIKSLTNIQE